MYPSNNVLKLIELGFSPKRLEINEIDDTEIKSFSRFVRVAEVIDEDRFSDTYCFTEEKNHTGIFNGVMTGQCQFAILLYNKLKNKLSKERIHEIFKEAVEIETEFINESISCKMVGMNTNLMARYIKYVASFWMHKLRTKTGHKCSKLYSAKNPFTFMDRNGMDGKTNFFEQPVSEYTRSESVVSTETFKNLGSSFDF